ncbi:MAG: glycosyltransferase family 2 protein [Rhodospirillaceae bacterium]
MNTQKSADKQPRVCIAIVTYNSSGTLPQCLSSLKSQTYKDFCVVLIDNDSDVKPTAIVENAGFPITYMEMDENLGFAKAMNIALNNTNCEYLAALNPDAFAEPEWLAELVAMGDKNPSIAALGSLQLKAEDRNYIDGLGDNLLITGQAWRGQTQQPNLLNDKPAYCFGVCAAAALYRAQILRDVGEFDETFFCFYEDVDMSFRLRLAGFNCAINTKAVVEHVGGASFEGKSDFAAYLMARNQWWMLLKNMPALFFIISLPGFFLIQIIGILKNPKSARMKGIWEGLRNSKQAWMKRSAIQKNRRLSSLSLSRWLSWRPRDFFNRKIRLRQNAKD